MSSDNEPADVFEGPEVLDGLIDAANSASADTRTLYLTFLLAGTYVAITIGSTSDEQLLRLAAVKLPVLGVGVPIVAFYTLVPWLIVVLHLNLLLQLYFLARRLHPLKDRFRRGIIHWIDRLHSFPFTHYVVGSQHGLVAGVVTTIVVTSFLLFPLALLIGAQVRFLPYHDVVLTWSQRAAVLADLLLLWIFWPMIRETGMSWSRWFKGLFADLRKAASDCAKWRPGGKTRLSEALGALTGGIGRANNVLYLAILSALVIAFSVFIATVPGEGVETALGGSAIPSARRLLFESSQSPFRRNLHLAEAVLVRSEPPAELLRALEAGRKGDRNDESLASERSKALDRIRGLDLSGRNLRGANLRNAVLVNADLRGADLSHAVLRGADLGGAKLHLLFTPGGCASKGQWLELSSELLRGAAGLALPPIEPGELVEACATLLQRADLMNTWLVDTKLHHAVLIEANLESADLDNTNLWKADLSSARLVGARFDEAWLVKAKLRGANAHGAWFIDADLQAADLRDADLGSAILDGAILSDAKLARADLERARMPLAQMNDASFEGAVLRDANLRAARGHGTIFEGADLKSAKLEWTHFPSSRLTAARLARARVGQAFFSGDMGLNDLRGLITTIFPVEQIGSSTHSNRRVRLERSDGLFWPSEGAGALLCDKNPVLRPVESRCLDDDARSTWAEMLADAACRSEGVAFGIAQQALLPAEASGVHDAPLLSHGSALARALLAAECPHARSLPEELRQKLAERAAAVQ